MADGATERKDGRVKHNKQTNILGVYNRYDIHILVLEFFDAAWTYTIHVDGGTHFFRLTLPAHENLERRPAEQYIGLDRSCSGRLFTIAG